RGRQPATRRTCAPSSRQPTRRHPAARYHASGTPWGRRRAGRIWVMISFRPVERRFERFMRKPLSVRSAMAVIVSATVASVVVGGLIISLVDGQDFPDIGIGMWWALQTVTTVGYGDVTPHTTIGRVIGAVIMVESIAFIAIVTAAITSSFVERARREQAAK